MRAFEDAHQNCPAGPKHTNYRVCVMKGSEPEASIIMTCICGAAITLPCTADEADTFVQALDARGHSGGTMTVFRDGDGPVH